MFSIIFDKKINNFFLILKNKKVTFNKLPKYPINTKLSKNLLVKTKLINLSKYIIKILFKYTNIFVYISNSIGNNLNFYSINSIFKNKKNKLKINDIIKKIFMILIKKNKKLKNKPFTFYIENINKSPIINTFIKKIINNFYLIYIVFYSNYPYNGCRKKEMAELV